MAMNFAFTEQQDAIRESVAKLSADRLAPATASARKRRSSNAKSSNCSARWAAWAASCQKSTAAAAWTA